MLTKLQVTEEERQLILYALAHLAVERPAWDAKLASVAATMDPLNEQGQPQLFFALKLQEIDPLHQLRGRPPHNLEPIRNWTVPCLHL